MACETGWLRRPDGRLSEDCGSNTATDWPCRTRHFLIALLGMLDAVNQAANFDSSLEAQRTQDLVLLRDGKRTGSFSKKL
jgi:hypothetical protein